MSVPDEYATCVRQMLSMFLLCLLNCIYAIWFVKCMTTGSCERNVLGMSKKCIGNLFSVC